MYKDSSIKLPGFMYVYGLVSQFQVGSAPQRVGGCWTFYQIIKINLILQSVRSHSYCEKKSYLLTPPNQFLIYCFWFYFLSLGIVPMLNKGGKPLVLHTRPMLFSADSDPHFLLHIPNGNVTVCFNIMAQQGNILNLISDTKLGKYSLATILIKQYVLQKTNVKWYHATQRHTTFSFKN